MIGSILAAVAAASCSIFPSDFSTNRPVTGLPVLKNSNAIISSIGLDTAIHPDFGTVYGIPYDRVSSSTPGSTVSFDYGDESDHVQYPIPGNVHIEGGAGADGDRHALLFDEQQCRLWELFALDGSPGNWHAGSGATWNLRSKKLRPKGWTSADAAGLPIFPLLARQEEVARGAIKHAIRMTVVDSRASYVYPARHFAADSNSRSLPRMGERIRLKQGVSLRGLSPQAKIVAKAMKKYGLIVADNGSDWYITGDESRGWDDDDLHSLGRLTGRDFQVVDASSLR